MCKSPRTHDTDSSGPPFDLIVESATLRTARDGGWKNRDSETLICYFDR
jgi:hypothetical protein